jgi:Zn-dependent alcohol dehydrogenase
MILGHEGAGYVRAVGSAVDKPDVKIGDFVLLSYNYCGNCKQCKRGVIANCLNGYKTHMGAQGRDDGSTPARLKRDGRAVRSQYFGQSSFSKMSVVKDSCVVKFDGDPESAYMFAACGCGFQTGAGTVLNILKPRKDDSIVVFGMGSVGLTALMAAKHLEVEEIIAVDILEQRLKLAKELGATELINAKKTPDYKAGIERITGGAGADFAVDCAGNVLPVVLVIR